MQRHLQILLIAATLGSSWLAMLAVHELGHVLHAWLSGGTVVEVEWPPLGISRTEVDPNPAPQFVAWGGAVWGVLIPLGIWIVARLVARRRAWLPAFFAGFCCLANGFYLGQGSLMAIGDARDLLRYGVPHWPLLLYGVACIGTGLWLWNGLGMHFGLGKARGAVDRRAAVAMALVFVALMAASSIYSLL